MNILAIESSSQVLSLALSCSSNVCCQLKKRERFKSEHIIGLLKNLFNKTNLRLSDLDYIAVGLGPGSFTGLRVGIATAMGLAFGSHLKIMGIGSLDLIAYNIKGIRDKDICSIVDARRGNLYTAVFTPLETAYSKRRSLTGRATLKPESTLPLKKKLKSCLLKPEQLLAKINSPTLFVGDGVKIFENTRIKSKSKFISFAPEKFWYPQASVLAKIAYTLIKNKKVKHKDNKPVLPIYIYPKECQIRNEKHKS